MDFQANVLAALLIITSYFEIFEIIGSRFVKDRFWFGLIFPGALTNSKMIAVDSEGLSTPESRCRNSDFGIILDGAALINN